MFRCRLTPGPPLSSDFGPKPLWTNVPSRKGKGLKSPCDGNRELTARLSHEQSLEDRVDKSVYEARWLLMPIILAGFAFLMVAIILG